MRAAVDSFSPLGVVPSAAPVAAAADMKPNAMVAPHAVIRRSMRALESAAARYREALACAYPLFAVLVAADVVLIGLHIAYTVKLVGVPFFSLEGERVAGEVLQHAKELSIVLASAALYRGTRQPMFGAWTGFFAYLLADDVLEIHERIGCRLAEALRLAPFRGMEPYDVGQALFAAAAAAEVLLVMVLLARTADGYARSVSRSLLFGLGLLGMSAVAGDALHALTRLEAFVILEEGGELLAMSCICTFVISEVRRRRTPPAWLVKS